MRNLKVKAVATIISLVTFILASGAAWNVGR